MRRAERLFELQQVDLALDAARRRVREIDALLADSEALRAARQIEQQLAEQLAHLRTRSRDLELQTATLDRKILSVDERLYSGAIKNPKELSDLQRDAAALRRQKAGLDDTLLEVILEIEQAEQQQQLARAERERVESDWQGRQAVLTEERAAVVRQVAEHEAERDARRASVDPADLDTYDALRARKHGQAVARLTDDVCGACGVQPSANKRTHLERDDALIACGNCERILLVA